MSGIAFIYGVKEGRAEQLKGMLEKIKHRGPDLETAFSGHNHAVGYCHLATADDSGVHLVRKKEYVLSDGRFFFNERPDSNLQPSLARQKLIDLYHSLGPDAITKINGEFVIFISTGENLLLARDPFGLKPFYYGRNQNTYYFASEIKALIDVVEGIKEFPPGHYWTPQTGFVRYFSLRPVSELDNADIEEIKFNLRQYLNAALKIRLPGNEKIGILLSGGLDSSIIAALAAEVSPKVATFTVGLPGASDLLAARSVAEYLGTEHHEFLFSETELLNHASEVIYYLESFDLPLVRSSLANYLVSKLAKENGVKVVCVGEGADELFGGYHYLKELPKDQVNAELLHLIYSGRKGGFQRVDRMNAANSIEPLIPFMDSQLLSFALTIPIDLKIWGKDKIEKWILREAFAQALPSQITERVKQKFFQGSGSGIAASTLFDKLVDTEKYEKSQKELKGHLLRNKEEFYYYQIYRQYYQHPSIMELMHQTKNI
ncbi:MAG: asparagine synthase-related protein [Bacillota bacterium]